MISGPLKRYSQSRISFVTCWSIFAIGFCFWVKSEFYDRLQTHYYVTYKMCLDSVGSTKTDEASNRNNNGRRG